MKTYGLLGGSWDLVTTYNWAYNPTHIPLNGLNGVAPIISRVYPSPLGPPSRVRRHRLKSRAGPQCRVASELKPLVRISGLGSMNSSYILRIWAPAIYRRNSQTPVIGIQVAGNHQVWASGLGGLGLGFRDIIGICPKP